MHNPENNQRIFSNGQPSYVLFRFVRNAIAVGVLFTFTPALLYIDIGYTIANGNQTTYPPGLSVHLRDPLPRIG